MRVSPLCFAVFALSCAPAPLALELRNPVPLLVPYEEIEFHRPIPIVAPEMAALWGDRDEGASGNEERQPAGAVSSLHLHPSDTYAVVLRGEMTHQFEGGPAASVLGPGSFYTLPAESPHVSTCRDGADCLIAYWQPDKLGYSGVKPGEHASKPGQSLAAAEIPFLDLPERPAAAHLWGDPQQGRSGWMERHAAGSSFPARRYAGEVHGVVVTGVASLRLNGGDARSAPAGSYFVLPEGASLESRCQPGAECRFLLFFPGSGGLYERP